jgi:Response regulator containing a CheY-like receiver domain and an HTH DNA-binding domain
MAEFLPDHLQIEEIPEPYRIYLERAAFANHIIHSLPAVIYINQLDVSGDSNSMRNLWYNRKGHDLIGYSREEIDQLKYDFLKTLIHPDDHEIVPTSYSWHSDDHSEMTFICIYRIRPKNSTQYHWLYNQTIVIGFFEDGSPKKSLSVAMEISEVMHTDNQLSNALKEIARLKNELRLSHLTKREKEVLGLIAKGKTDKEIASELFISITTAKKHRTNLIVKTEVKNTAELVAFAMENGR